MRHRYRRLGDNLQMESIKDGRLQVISYVSRDTYVSIDLNLKILDTFELIINFKTLPSFWMQFMYLSLQVWSKLFINPMLFTAHKAPSTTLQSLVQPLLSQGEPLQRERVARNKVTAATDQRINATAAASRKVVKNYDVHTHLGQSGASWLTWYRNGVSPRASPLYPTTCWHLRIPN